MYIYTYTYIRIYVYMSPERIKIWLSYNDVTAMSP